MRVHITGRQRQPEEGPPLADHPLHVVQAPWQVCMCRIWFKITCMYVCVKCMYAERARNFHVFATYIYIYIYIYICVLVCSIRHDSVSMLSFWSRRQRLVTLPCVAVLLATCMLAELLHSFQLLDAFLHEHDINLLSAVFSWCKSARHLYQIVVNLFGSYFHDANLLGADTNKIKLSLPLVFDKFSVSTLFFSFMSVLVVHVMYMEHTHACVYAYTIQPVTNAMKPIMSVAHSYVRTCIHTYMHTYMDACIHDTARHERYEAYHVCCTFVRTYIHTYIHKYIHTYINTYIQT